MTIVGSGGVVIKAVTYGSRFKKEYKKLSNEMQGQVNATIDLLVVKNRPAGIRFEKLKGYANPNIFTVHVTGNYKLSFEINGSTAFLRRVGNHNEIDRAP
jgi:mRNA-degrading endonuclease RelE of RelBE toxin-antitoxin system